MPKSKTIEIDEVVTPKKTQGGRSGHQQDRFTSSANGSQQGRTSGPIGARRESKEPSQDNPFSQFHQSLSWKARITLRLTQWFVLLRSKSWGKLVIVPAVIVAVLIAIPLALIAGFLLILRMLFFSRR